MALFQRIKTWVTGEVVTATDLNGEFNNLLGGFTPTKIDGLSSTVAAMQQAISPGSTGAENRAGSLSDEVLQMRYVAQHVKGTANWYTPLLDSQSTPQEISLQSLYTQVQGILTNIMPPGLIAPYGGTSAPTGWLLCDGTAYARTGTYANLFTAIGTSFGYGDNSTTFNVPDLRGMFLRGAIGTLASSGSGTVDGANGNCTFTGHGLRTGMRIRMISGAIGSTSFASGLNLYFVRVLDANTIQLYPNPTAATNIGSTSQQFLYSGANTANLVQAQDPDASFHFRQTAGGAATGVGSGQGDSIPSHVHNSPALLSVSSSSVAVQSNAGSPTTVLQSITNNYSAGGSADGPSVLGLAGSTISIESRPLSTTVNYIIRF